MPPIQLVYKVADSELENKKQFVLGNVKKHE